MQVKHGGSKYDNKSPLQNNLPPIASHKNPKIYIIAGEVSGDIIGAKLMLYLKKLVPEVNIHGVGGAEMESQGLRSYFKYDQINLMGFVEVLPHIFRLNNLIKNTVNDIIAKDPAILITIDSPGFNYRVAKLTRKLCPSMKMVHIVAPSVWAYKPDRAAKFAAIYNHMLTLLPFEPPYFEAVGLPATCIGHPVFDQKFGGGEEFRVRHGISQEAKVVVITPGSRQGEIKRHLPLFMKVLEKVREKYKDLVIIIPSLKIENLEEFYKNYSSIPKEKIILIDFSRRIAAFAAADVALAKSGTNTLEIAASGTPMIVAYKMNFFTYVAVKLMAKIKYASLINIVANKEVIPEFLQHNATCANLTSGLLKILDNPHLGKEQVRESMNSLKAMGFGSKISSAAQAAKVIAKCL